MKLYLREILKEANALGFGAPGQGGNSADVSMAQTAPGPSMPSMGQPPLMQPNQQMGGMQLPGMSPSRLGGMQQLNLQTPGFKPMI